MTDETFEKRKDIEQPPEQVYQIQIPLSIIICGLNHEFVCEIDFTFEEKVDLIQYKNITGIDATGTMYDFSHMVNLEHPSGASLESIILNNHANWNKDYFDGDWK